LTRRTQRVGDLLRSELSTIIRRRVSDPRVAMTSVTSVEMSPDLKHARILVSVVGTDEERQASLAALEHASGYIRGQLGRGLKRLKNVPELRFELDRGAEYSQRISELLESPDEHEQST
jgi:ribosome-binding factor A